MLGDTIWDTNEEWRDSGPMDRREAELYGLVSFRSSFSDGKVGGVSSQRNTVQ